MSTTVNDLNGDIIAFWRALRDRPDAERAEVLWFNRPPKIETDLSSTGSTIRRTA